MRRHLHRRQRHHEPASYTEGTPGGRVEPPQTPQTSHGGH
jgi:hypothetical protein